MTRTHIPLLLAALALATLPGLSVATPAAPGAALGGSFPVALAQVVDAGVLDDVGLFSPEAVASARDKVRQIRKEYHVAVFIDTVNKAPAADWSAATSWSGQKRDAYFHQWALDRSRELGVEGVHILICKQPRHVAVVAWPETVEADFGPKECKGLERLFTRELVSAPDETLLTALNSVGTSLKARREPQPPSVAFAPLGIFIVAVIGMWLLLCVVRLRLRKPEPFSLTGEPQTARLAAGLLAGMFGNPAAFWITDRLFPHETTGSAHDLLLEDVSPPSEEGLDAADTDDREPMPEHAEVWRD